MGERGEVIQQSLTCKTDSKMGGRGERESERERRNQELATQHIIHHGNKDYLLEYIT